MDGIQELLSPRGIITIFIVGVMVVFGILILSQIEKDHPEINETTTAAKEGLSTVLILTIATVSVAGTVSVILFLIALYKKFS